MSERGCSIFTEESVKAAWCHSVSGISTERGRKGRGKSEQEEEEVGQGRNLHSEAQIDAKQLLNSCKVEQLLGRQRERDGGDERSRKRQRDPGDMLKY